MKKDLRFVVDENGYGTSTYELKHNNLVVIYHPVYDPIEWYFQLGDGVITFTSPDGGDSFTVEGNDVKAAIERRWGMWDYDHPNIGGDIIAISFTQVMQSAAGYYVGHSCLCDDGEGVYECPYDRVSGYFRKWEDAAKHAQYLYMEC